MSENLPSSQARPLDHSQLREENARLRQALARAQKLAGVGTMAAMVAHEFNNLLTPMLNYAQMALSSQDPILQAKAIQAAHDGSTRAARICQSLLDFAGTRGDQPEKATVESLVDQTLSAMARDFAKDGITLVKKIPPKLCLTTRPGELKQVLLNLLLNARAAAMEKGRGQSISISADQADGQVFIRVADTGVGIAPENLERIFEAFFTTKGEGTGLGLAVSRQVIEGLSGRLSVRSELGKGTVFTIALPADKPTGRKRRASVRREASLAVS